VASLSLRELLANGRIDVLGFYSRRVRRLLPAASAAIVGIALLAIAVVPLQGRISLEGDARAASLWFSNWHFIGEQTQYFESSFIPTAYLHFWSLAIEEQFYILFPLVLSGLWLASGRRLRRMTWWMTSITIALCALQLMVAQGDATRAYYGADTRAYQISAGVTLALASLQFPALMRSRRTGPVLVVFGGFGTLALASNLWDVSPSTRGVAATLLIAAVIVGAESSPREGLGHLPTWALSRPTLTYLGQISYGTYLWHWPIIVFAGALIDASPLPLAALSALVGTGLAALSFELLEQPIRTSPRLKPFRAATVVTGLALAAVVGLLVVPAILRSSARPVVESAQHTLHQGIQINPINGLDLDLDGERGGGSSLGCIAADGSDCIVRVGNGPTVVVVGDSHAGMLGASFRHLANELDLTFALVSRGACP